MDQKKEDINMVQATKVMSSNFRCREGIMPQWSTEAHINYTSEFDFISYDLDEDKSELFQRPTHDHIVCIRYPKLIGSGIGRIIYLIKDGNQYWLVVMPPFQNSEKYEKRRIKHQYLEIVCIRSFLYNPDSHSIVLAALFSNNKWGVICQFLKENRVMTLQWDIPQFTIDDDFFKNVSIIQCTRKNFYIIMTPGKLEIIKIPEFSKNIQSFTEHYFDEELVQPQYLCLSKNFVIGRFESILKCFVFQQYDKIDKQLTFATNIKQQIYGMAGNGNKIVIWLKNKPIIYLYSLSDMQEKISFLNTIDFESEKINRIESAIVSESARNMIIVWYCQSLGQKQEKNKIVQNTKESKVSNLFIFKLELFSELKINDNSLYIKRLKNLSRNRRVNRLILPKLYEELYVLTGSQLHTLSSHLLMGILSFGIHPFGLFLAVAVGFNIKIYSLEYNSMTLLFNMPMHNVKKIVYSPDGAYLLLLSPRKLKILDTYSFEVLYEQNQKMNTIMNLCISPINRNFYILLDSGVLIQKNLLDFSVVNSFRIYDSCMKKIVEMQIEEESKYIFMRLQDGCLMSKNLGGGKLEQLFFYADRQIVTSFLIESNHSIIILGTKSGKIRIHSSQLFRMCQFMEKTINASEITCMVFSPLQNYLYVGSSEGDITILSLSTPNDINISLNNSKHNSSIYSKNDSGLGSPFRLLSSAKFNGNAEMNCLQDKLQNLFEKIQSHTTENRHTMIERYQQEEKNLRESTFLDKKQFFSAYQAKSSKLKNQRNYIKQKLQRFKIDETQDYQKRVKQIYAERQKLEKQKQKIEQRNNCEKQQERNSEKIEEQFMKKDLINKYKESEKYYNGEKIGKDLLDGDQNDNEVFAFCEKEGLEYLKKSLQKQLQCLLNKCSDLKKNNGYLQTAKKNMLARKVQEETLSYRVNNQLHSLDLIRSQQQSKIQKIGNDLKYTEEVIHKIQNKAKSGPNVAISSDKVDNDLCSYKIWVNNRANDEVEKLTAHLNSLDQIFQKKSQELVGILNERKQFAIKEEVLKEKRLKCKNKLKKLRDSIFTMEVHFETNKKKQPVSTHEQRNSSQRCSFEEITNHDTRIAKLISMERLHEKGIHFENKNLKIHMRKICKLNGQSSDLLNEYKKLKYEGKDLIDKKRAILRGISNVQGELLHKKPSKIFSPNNFISTHCSPKNTSFIHYIRTKDRKSKQKSLNNVPQFRSTGTSPKKGHERSSRNSNRDGLRFDIF